MRPRSILMALVLLAGCGEAPARNALCAYCSSDAQCAGNPCFQDVSGNRFCGSPCDACPAGFSCQTVMGTSGPARTCFPDTEACPAQGGGPDASVQPPASDGGTTQMGDLAANIGGIPVGGAVGPTGGTVDRLFFGFTGDTRPSDCSFPQTPYPQSIIDNIFMQMHQMGVEFAVDQGDHMFNCGTSANYYTQDLAAARAQLSDYITGANLLGKTVFMTMGNHECSGEAQTLCTLSSYGNNANYTAYMDALKPVASKPYYRFDVMTKSGLAVFLVVADDVWDSAEQSWLTAQLTDADTHAKYTFVSKHHPDGNTDHPQFQTIYNLVRAHKYTLFLTGHSHLYKRQYDDPRALVMGVGGAPLAGSNFFGYGTALQGADDRIYVSIFDQSTGNAVDSFDVGPQ